MAYLMEFEKVDGHWFSNCSKDELGLRFCSQCERGESSKQGALLIETHHLMLFS